MKKLRIILTSIFLILAIFVFTGCGKAPQPTNENPLLGKWRDAYGLTEYEFLDSRRLKLIVRGIAPFEGTYQIDEGTFWVRYKLFGKWGEKTYQYRYEGDRFYLDQNEFIREEV